MTSRPPGLSTRYISASAFLGSSTLRRPKEIVTASNSPSEKGRAMASASTKVIPGCFCRPTSIIPAEKSAATTSAPVFARAAELVPVPAAMSRIRSPASGATARVVAIRQMKELPIDNTSFVRS
jgi:hypothetical protein